MDRLIGVILIAGIAGISAQKAEWALPISLDECHPTPSFNKTHYLVAYGSLMNQESKARTSPDTGINIPVRVSGYKRSWTLKGCSNISVSTTYLGVDVDPKSVLNGAIFTVKNAEAVEKYDLREKYYCRAKVPFDQIKVLRGNGTFPSDEELSEAEFWIYVTSPSVREYPDEQYPITQSYVDIFLSGCLQLERKYAVDNFAQNCIETTVGWEYPWVNDRIQPRRAWTYQPDSVMIDGLINRNIKGHKSRLYLERFYVGRSGSSGGNRLGVSSLVVMLVLIWL